MTATLAATRPDDAKLSDVDLQVLVLKNRDVLRALVDAPDDIPSPPWPTRSAATSPTSAGPWTC